MGNSGTKKGFVVQTRADPGRLRKAWRHRNVSRPVVPEAYMYVAQTPEAGRLDKHVTLNRLDKLDYLNLLKTFNCLL